MAKSVPTLTIRGLALDQIAAANMRWLTTKEFLVGATNGVVWSLAVQPDGSILAGGSFTTLGGQTRTNLARLHADGTLDSTFVQGANNIVYSLTLMADGKILVGGNFTMLGG